MSGDVIFEQFRNLFNGMGRFIYDAYGKYLHIITWRQFKRIRIRFSGYDITQIGFKLKKIEM